MIHNRIATGAPAGAWSYQKIWHINLVFTYKDLCTPEHKLWLSRDPHIWEQLNTKSSSPTVDSVEGLQDDDL